MLRLALACTLLALTSGCFIFYPTSRGQMLEARVDTLESNQKDLQQQRDEHAKQLTALRTDVTDLQARLDKLEKMSRTGNADTGVQLEALREDLAKLQGQVDEYQHHLDQIDAAIKKVQSDTTTEIGQIDPALAQQRKDQATLASLQRPTDKKAFLKLADDQNSSGSTGVAKALYNEFLQKWPRDPLAANAHYALGKIEQSTNDCRTALSEFGDVIQKFEKSDRVPPSLMRSYECFTTLGMKEEARTALEFLVKSYGSSEEGQQAREKLKKLPKGKKGH